MRFPGFKKRADGESGAASPLSARRNRGRLLLWVQTVAANRELASSPAAGFGRAVASSNSGRTRHVECEIPVFAAAAAFSRVPEKSASNSRHQNCVRCGDIGYLQPKRAQTDRTMFTQVVALREPRNRAPLVRSMSRKSVCASAATPSGAFGGS